ncbi:hypothetical protein Acr_14g0006240 [Actinidia rufa]|uniref:Uncharacterized protein n=1 Tax=Actinidia rufa TaxID=165716 RepID=A0A7J0FQI7_9ERIC|nr:hypothetical protein Acr_14g0006240 [Actinidia rufa]
MAASLRWIVQLHKDVPKAAKFYSEGLDLTINVCTLRWAELQSGPLKLALLHSPRPYRSHAPSLKRVPSVLPGRLGYFLELGQWTSQSSACADTEALCVQHRDTRGTAASLTGRDLRQVQEVGIVHTTAPSFLLDLRACGLEVKMRVCQARHRSHQPRGALLWTV